MATDCRSPGPDLGWSAQGWGADIGKEERHPPAAGRLRDFAILSIKEPKARFSAAKHQSVRVDQPNLLAVVTSVFGPLAPEERLWPASGQTSRNRFKQVARALGIPTQPGRDILHLELASLRAGGATWMIMSSDNPELVRRRGRWMNAKVTETYVQKVSCLHFLPQLSVAPRKLVLRALHLYAALWDQITVFN